MAGQLRVDEITNEAGTGSPSFPNGVAASTATTAGSITGTTTAAVPTSALGSGTANSTTFLAGDRTFKTVQTGPATGDYLDTTRTLSTPDYLVPDGSVYLQSTYPALFNIVGTKPDVYKATKATYTEGSAVQGATPNISSIKQFGNNFYASGYQSGSSSTSATVWRSTNNGSTWSIGYAITTDFSAYALQRCGDTLIAASVLNTGNTVKASRSTNGTSWTTVNVGANFFFNNSSLATDNVSTLYLSPETGYGAQVARSTDKGASWTMLTPGFSSGSLTVGSFHIENNTWVVVAEKSSAPISNEFRVTYDNGSTWSNFLFMPVPPANYIVGRVYTAGSGVNKRFFIVYSATVAGIPSNLTYVADTSFNWKLMGSFRTDTEPVYTDGLYLFHNASNQVLLYSFNGLDFLAGGLVGQHNIFDVSSTNIVMRSDNTASNPFRSTITRTLFTYNTSTQFVVPTVPAIVGGTRYIKT